MLSLAHDNIARLPCLQLKIVHSLYYRPLYQIELSISRCSLWPGRMSFLLAISIKRYKTAASLPEANAGGYNMNLSPRSGVPDLDTRVRDDGREQERLTSWWRMKNCLSPSNSLLRRRITLHCQQHCDWSIICQKDAIRKSSSVNKTDWMMLFWMFKQNFSKQTPEFHIPWYVYTFLFDWTLYINLILINILMLASHW